MVQLRVVLGGAQEVFYSGQSVDGEVVVQLRSPKQITGVILHFVGKAKVVWKNGETTYKNKETYLDERVVLHRGETTLDAGERRFPFSFPLPANIPSSFKDSYGRVRYSVRCELARPWGAGDVALRHFSVVCPVDLNARPELALPASKSGTKELFCVCRQSGPLSVTLALAARGAVSGQSLLASCEVENLTRDRFLVSLELVKLLVYKDKKYTKCKSRVVSQKTLGTLAKGDSQSWANEPVLVPALPPSGLDFCSIIDLSYHLKLIAHPYGLHSKLEVSLPVTVGTIPFHQHFRSFRPSDEEAPPPPGWNLATPPPGTDRPPDYDDLPPPSYQQCLQDGPPQDEGEGPSFLPKYPVYTLENS